MYGPVSPNATGRPVILASAEDPGVLAVDTSSIADPDGIPNVGDPESTGVLYDFSYRWIRVDGDTETVVGADSVDYRQVAQELVDAGFLIESGRYRRVEDDVGKLLKVEVSFTDALGRVETVTSLPFGPVPPPRTLPELTLVSNTGQAPSAPATINGRYAMGFELGSHGQGYEISEVSIDLAAAPSTLTVSLWMGRAPGSARTAVQTKLFEFKNPDSFAVGLNTFTAPAGAFAYQNVPYFIVLSDFGSSLSIRETTLDDQDPGGETGATLADSAGGDSSVLRLAVKGSKRDRGILVSTYAQASGLQEIVSVGDTVGVEFTVGAADRYLIRGVSFSGDNTSLAGQFTDPWLLRDGTDELFRLISTRQISGINEFTAHQGATVPGGCATDEVTMEETCEAYNFHVVPGDPRVGGVVLSRYFGTASADEDSPKATGVTIGDSTGDFALATPLMAIFGEPLHAMVQNLGQTDNGYVSLGGTNDKVASQGFTTGSDPFGYRLQGIGVNIEGSVSDGNPQVPDGPTSVSVSVHADSSGKPGEKLFDLVSPTEFAPGHSFFEAPPGTALPPNISYVLVWKYTGGTWHRLQRTASNSEDSGARSGSGIANSFYLGADLDNLSEDSGSNALEMVVYTEVRERASFVPGGIEVPLSWLHIPDGATGGYQFRLLFVTHRGLYDLDRKDVLLSDNIEDYNDFVREEARAKYSDPIIRANASEFKAVVCTENVNAQTNTDMAGAIGVPIHWLDGGWEHRPTLIARSYAGFYSPDWINRDRGAHVTGNSHYFHEDAMVWTGCDAAGATDPMFPMSASPNMGMVAVGTPRDEDTNRAPIGRIDVDGAPLTAEFDKERRLPLYAISPIFTVVGTIPPPRNLSGTVDADGVGLSLDWDPPRGYEESEDVRYEVWWRNPGNGSAWEPLASGTKMTAGTGTDATYSISGGGTTGLGALSATTFRHGSTTYTVTQLIAAKVTGDADSTADLALRLSPLPSGDGSLALTLSFLSGETVQLTSESTSSINKDTTDDEVTYNWDNIGLFWDDGETVFFTLEDADGNIVLKTEVVRTSDSEFTDPDRYDRTYGVRMVDDEGRKSARVRYRCSERTGCANIPTP